MTNIKMNLLKIINNSLKFYFSIGTVLCLNDNFVRQILRKVTRDK